MSISFSDILPRHCPRKLFRVFAFCVDQRKLSTHLGPPLRYRSSEFRCFSHFYFGFLESLPQATSSNLAFLLRVAKSSTRFEWHLCVCLHTNEGELLVVVDCRCGCGSPQRRLARGLIGTAGRNGPRGMWHHTTPLSTSQNIPSFSRKLLTLNRDRMTQIMFVTFSVHAFFVAIPAVCNVNRERIPIDSVKSSLPSFSADKSCQLARLAYPDDCGVQSPLSTRSYISICLQVDFFLCPCVHGRYV